MTNKEKELLSIDKTQDFYVEKLIEIINGTDSRYKELKEIDFTSPTGTGKTIMVSKLINRLPNYFFVITTLSRGQLSKQIKIRFSHFQDIVIMLFLALMNIQRIRVCKKMILFSRYQKIKI